MERILEIKERIKYHKDEINNLTTELNTLNFIKHNHSNVYSITQKILISETCSNTSPCNHECIMENFDGSINYITMNGRDIASNLHSILSENGKSHFSVYL
jgi:hypothetical protein